MSLPTLDVRNLLVNGNVGASGVNADPTEFSIFIGIEPPDPDRTITLYDTPGGVPNPKWLLDYPQWQIRVRSLEYTEAYEKAEEAKSVLLGLPSQDIDDIRYVGIWVVADTAFLKADDRGRIIFVTTYRCIREPTEGQHRLPL